MTDTPINPPATGMERWKAFIGDLARPFAIISTSLAASWATVVIAYKVTTFGEAALFIAAVFTGVSALYAGKAWENARASRHAADVEIARTTSQQQPPVS